MFDPAVKPMIVRTLVGTDMHDIEIFGARKMVQEATGYILIELQGRGGDGAELLFADEAGLARFLDAVQQ